MTITKEYPHPFFNVVLNYDETMPETEYEKELVKRYLEWLTKLQEKRDMIKAIRNRCFQLQLLDDESIPTLKENTARYESLLQRAEEFKNGIREDREGFTDLDLDTAEANRKYNQHRSEVVDQIRDIILQNEKDITILSNWFDEEEDSNEYEHLDKYGQELYKNYDNYGLDLVSWDRSIDAMKGPWGKLIKEWEEFIKVWDKTIGLQASYNAVINEENNAASALEDIMEELGKGKFAGKEVSVEEGDAVCIQFRFLEKEMFVDPGEGFNPIGIQFRVDYDLEKISENIWIFGMDTYVHAPYEAFFQVRTSFLIPTNKEEMLQRNFLMNLIDRAFQNAFDCADEFYRKEKKKFDWYHYKMPGESRDFLIQNLTERTAGFDDSVEEENGYYNEAFFFRGTTLERGTILILNEVLYDNPAFNWDLNQKAFGEIIPMPVYVTLRCRVNASIERPLAINVGKLLAFMLCIECASQLLTGERFPDLEERLNEKKFDESVQRQYLKDAQQFIADVMEQMKEAGTHFMDMEENYRDWNEIIK